MQKMKIIWKSGFSWSKNLTTEIACSAWFLNVCVIIVIRYSGSVTKDYSILSASSQLFTAMFWKRISTLSDFLNSTVFFNPKTIEQQLLLITFNN